MIWTNPTDTLILDDSIYLLIQTNLTQFNLKLSYLDLDAS